jgi:hypothetical protein
MMTLMLATAGWCFVSLVVAAGWAVLMTGARLGEARNRPAHLSGDGTVPVETARVPRPRSADTRGEHLVA